MPRYIVLQDDGRESEPLSGRDLLALARSGRITAETLIRSERSKRWHRASGIPSLSVGAAAPPPRPSTPPASTDAEAAGDLQSIFDAELAQQQAPIAAIPMKGSARLVAGPSVRKRLSGSVVAIAIAIGFCYLCGWRIVANAYMPRVRAAYAFNTPPGQRPSFLLNEYGVSFTVNGRYYGLDNGGHAPFLQWAALVVAATAVSGTLGYGAVKNG
jgi:hypothetical protein